MIRWARHRNAPSGVGRGLGPDNKKWVGSDEEVVRF